ncbi:MAG: FAD-dependent oxidoreductase [Candidatus Bipolaricaulota bacterium]|nr:FAD-dependent oxidoreductase [Candidatus Bipolaricaulota bacterium]
MARQEAVRPEAAGSFEDVHDVLVLGGGPAGASAAIYAARAGLSTLVVDRGVTSGALGMSREIANYPGIPEGTPGADVVLRIRTQAERFGARFVADKVSATDLAGDVKTAYGTRGTYRGRAMIVASGAMGRARTLPGEERFVGRGVSYCATCDGFFFQDKTVAVAGATDEAIEEALFLTRFAARIHILSPSETLRCSPLLAEEAARSSSVTLHPSTTLEEILGDSAVEAVRVRTRGGAPTLLPVAGVFLYLQGGRPIIDFLGGQLPLTADGCLAVDSLFQTQVPGVFAAGDVLCKHLKQAVIAAAEGASAAVAADRFLAGREKLRPDWA